MNRYHFIFKGNVQGVGFRYTIKMLADKYNATGSVKNLNNGDVEAYIQQNEYIVNLIIDNLNNNRFIKIKYIDIEKIPCLEEYGFKILR